MPRHNNKNSNDMSRNRVRTRRSQERRLSVRSVRRDEPDTRKIARAIIAMALAEAEAEAELQAVRSRTERSDTQGDGS